MDQTDIYYLSAAKKIAKESSCLCRKVGAILVAEDGRIVAAVNDPVPDKRLCECEGCLRRAKKIVSGTQVEVCRCVHAEMMLIVQCALNGISPKGATVYTTLLPCSICARTLCIAGINRIVFLEPYPATDAVDIFSKFDIELRQLML